jgi:hypothetical protein
MPLVLATSLVQLTLLLHTCNNTNLTKSLNHLLTYTVHTVAAQSVAAAAASVAPLPRQEALEVHWLVEFGE